MNFLENEKNRIKNNYQKLLLSGFLFFYFISVQSNVSAHKVIFGKGLEAKPISFINPIVVLGILTLTLYLNFHLFWIKEQGKRVFILRKYDTIPLEKKEMYTAKFKIIFHNLSIFLLSSIVIYIGVLIFNSYLEIDILKNIFEIIGISILTAILLILLLAINLLQDKKSKKEL